MPRSNANPGTPDSPDEPDAVEAEPTLEDELASLPPKVLDVLVGLSDEVRELRAAVADQAAEQANVEEFVVDSTPRLAEGERRYIDVQYSEESLVRQPGRHMMVDGVRVFQEMLTVDFQDGIYTTGDPAEIEFIESHEGFGVRIFRDDTAVPRPNMPGLVTGGRQASDKPATVNPLAAPMD